MAEDETRPEGLQGSCSICLIELRQRDKISALVCGHIYHHGCIEQWMAAKKQCPSCRRPVPKNGFVEKLFFDIRQEPAGASQEVDFVEENYKLSASLKTEKEKTEKLEAENKEMKTTVKSLEKKILVEKNKNKSEIPKLQATINQLSVSVEEAKYLERELNAAKNKMKACEFYTILNTFNESADQKLNKYLKESGRLDTEKFFQLMRAQIKELQGIRKDTTKEVERLREEGRSKQKTINEQESIIKTLKQEVLSLRDRANVETPINKRLRSVMASETPARRISMGFDQTNPMQDDLSFFAQKDTEKEAEQAPGPSRTSDIPFSFDDDDEDEEYFRIPTKTTEEKVPQAVASKVKDEDQFDFSFDIPVPQSIINRIPTDAARNAVRRTNSQAAKANSLPKPVPLKRQLLEDSKKSKNVKPPPVKSARISSFFQRTTSSSSTSSNSNTEYVTLD